MNQRERESRVSVREKDGEKYRSTAFIQNKVYWLLIERVLLLSFGIFFLFSFGICVPDIHTLVAAVRIGSKAFNCYWYLMSQHFFPHQNSVLSIKLTKINELLCCKYQAEIVEKWSQIHKECITSRKNQQQRNRIYFIWCVFRRWLFSILSVSGVIIRWVLKWLSVSLSSSSPINFNTGWSHICVSMWSDDISAYKIGEMQSFAIC